MYFDQIQRTDDIVLVVIQRFDNGLSNSFQGSQMNDRVKVLLKNNE
jgi:hypothetical protein